MVEQPQDIVTEMKQDDKSKDPIDITATNHEKIKKKSKITINLSQIVGGNAISRTIVMTSNRQNKPNHTTTVTRVTVNSLGEVTIHKMPKNAEEKVSIESSSLQRKKSNE